MFVNQEITNILENIFDPEIPVLSIVDLGIVRKVNVHSHEEITIHITPTYSGCPAMDYISKEIQHTFKNNGYKLVHIQYILKPAWSTDWMSEQGKQKLEKYGIAPPAQKTTDKRALLGLEPEIVRCPKCKSTKTQLVSQFGSTACKALYKCLSCLEPFDYFKCL